MKENVELMLTMADVTGVLFERQLASFIEKQADVNRVGRQLCRMNRDLVGKAGIEILIPKSVDLDCTAVSEGVSQTLQSPSYDSVTCKVQIWGTAIEIGEETLEAANYNIMADQMENIGRAIATKEDKDIIKEMIDWTDVSSEESAVATGSITTVTLAYGNVIELAVQLSGATATTTYTVDYLNGVIHFESAPDSGASVDVTYAYNASVTTIQVATAGVLATEALIRARGKIESANYKPDTCIIHPDQWQDLLSESVVQDASKFGNNTAIMNGWVTKILGLDLFMTTQCPKGVAIVLDRKAAMMMVVKKEMWVKVSKEGQFAIKGSIGVIAKLWSAVCRVNDDAICMITNAQDDAEVN